MNKKLQRKASILLAGIATAPVISGASIQTSVRAPSVQTNVYCSPDSDREECSPNEDLTVVTGLNQQELTEGKLLVQEMKQLDVVAVQELILTKAPRIPYHYNLPEHSQVVAARAKNLDRLSKLRKMIEAAK